MTESILSGVALTHLEDPSNAKQAYEQAIAIETDNSMTLVIYSFYLNMILYVEYYVENFNVFIVLYSSAVLDQQNYQMLSH